MKVATVAVCEVTWKSDYASFKCLAELVMVIET